MKEAAVHKLSSLYQHCCGRMRQASGAQATPRRSNIRHCDLFLQQADFRTFRGFIRSLEGGVLGKIWLVQSALGCSLQYADAVSKIALQL